MSHEVAFTDRILVIGCRSKMVYLGRTVTVAFPETFVHNVKAYLDVSAKATSAPCGAWTELDLCYLCSLWYMGKEGHKWDPFNLHIGCQTHGTDPDKKHVATAVHKDCFVIAKQSCPLAGRDVCKRIWELAMARSPWPQGFQHPKSLRLESLYLISPQAVNRIASIVDIPQLKTLPPNWSNESGPIHQEILRFGGPSPL